jgi:hypothetical protein
LTIRDALLLGRKATAHPTLVRWAARIVFGILEEENAR